MAFEPGNKLGRKFQPGRSGNPGGRPRAVLGASSKLWADLAEIVDAHWATEDAKEHLRMWLRMKTAKGHLPDVLRVTRDICPQPLATVSDGRSKLADVPLHVLIEAAKPLLTASDPLDAAKPVSGETTPPDADAKRS